MLGRLAKGNDMDAIARFGVHDRNDQIAQQSKSNESFLAISEPIVFESKRGPGEHRRRIDEIETVFSQISAALRFIPSEAHIRSVYTSSPSVNGRARTSGAAVRADETSPTSSCRRVASLAKGSTLKQRDARPREKRNRQFG